MRIPVSTIVLTASNGACVVKTQPSYFAPVYQRVWAGRLADANGLVVTELPPGTPDGLRYLDVDSVEEAERSLISYFAGGAGSGGDGRARAESVAAMIRSLFPDGLRPEIERLINLDMARIRREAAERAAVAAPHPSYLEARISPEVAVALQRRGYATLSALPNDVVVLAEAGLTPVQAVEILDKVHGAPAPRRPKTTPPLPE